MEDKVETVIHTDIIKIKIKIAINMTKTSKKSVMYLRD